MPKFFDKIIEQVFSSFDTQGKHVQLLKKELENNLLDHKEHLISQGMNPKKAEAVVAKNFGDPAVIGKLFQRFCLPENIKKAKVLANSIAAVSIIIGLDYVFRATWAEIRYWGILAIIGGIGAVIASKTMAYSRLWQNRAIFGFFFLAIGQIVPFLAGLELLSQRGSYCAMGSDLSVFCTRLNEVFLGLGLHFLLFSLCLWAVYVILFPKKSTNQVFRIE